MSAPLPILRGSSLNQLQEWKMRYSPSQGGELTKEWRGININNMLSQAAYDAGIGCELELTYKHDVATLTTRSTNPIIAGYTAPFNAIVDKWEVAVENEQPSLTENQTFLQLIQVRDAAAMSATGFNLVSHQILAAFIKHAGNQSSTNAWGDFYKEVTKQGGLQRYDGTTVGGGTARIIEPGTVNLIGAYPNVKNFFADYHRGATNFARSKYVVRHTTSAPNTYGANVADFNVERIYSIATLLSEVQSSSLWVFPMPGYLAYKVLNYPVPVNMPPNFAFGGLKFRANAITSARNRVEISQEYLIDAWPQHTYQAVL